VEKGSKYTTEDYAQSLPDTMGSSKKYLTTKDPAKLESMLPLLLKQGGKVKQIYWEQTPAGFVMENLPDNLPRVS
jgi:hypothetical protein